MDYIGVVPDPTGRALKLRRCSRLDTESLKNGEVFRIGLGEPQKKGGGLDLSGRALKTSRCSKSDLERPKKQEVFRIGLKEP